MSQLHREQISIDNHRRTQASTESQEKHATAFIATQGLHGRIVDDLYGAVESLLEVKANPSLAEVMRLREDPAIKNGPRVPDGDHFIFPIGGNLPHFVDHLLGGERRPGSKLPARLVSRSQQLDVRAAYIDGKYLHRSTPLADTNCQYKLMPGMKSVSLRCAAKVYTTGLKFRIWQASTYYTAALRVLRPPIRQASRWFHPIPYKHL